MNTLQKNHKKSLKRKAKQVKHREYESAKTGRAKVERRRQEEHRRLLVAEMLKEKPKSTSDLISMMHSPTDNKYSSSGYSI